MYNAMISFVNSVNGAPYGFKLSNLLFSPEFNTATATNPGAAQATGTSTTVSCREEDNEPSFNSSNSINSTLLARIVNNISQMSCTRLDEENSPLPSSCCSASSIQNSVSNQKLTGIVGSNNSSPRTTTSVHSSPHESQSQSQSQGSNNSSNNAYFCSELAAALLISMGIIPANHNPSFFWPDSFAQHKYLDSCIVQQSDRNSMLSLHQEEEDKDDMVMIPDAILQESSHDPDASVHGKGNATGDATNTIGYYGDELLIDCNVIEVAKAKVISTGFKDPLIV